jgi:hypothetical protein
LSLIAVEQKLRVCDLAVKNAKAAIEETRRLMQYYSEDSIDESGFDNAVAFLSNAAEHLKIQTKALKESEGYRREYEESYYGVRVGKQEDLFGRPQPDDTESGRVGSFSSEVRADERRGSSTGFRAPV